MTRHQQFYLATLICLPCTDDDHTNCRDQWRYNIHPSKNRRDPVNATTYKCICSCRKQEH
jgi:hypothetical protein